MRAALQKKPEQIVFRTLASSFPHDTTSNNNKVNITPHFYSAINVRYDKFETYKIKHILYKDYYCYQAVPNKQGLDSCRIFDIFPDLYEFWANCSSDRATCMLILQCQLHLPVLKDTMCTRENFKGLKFWQIIAAEENGMKNLGKLTCRSSVILIYL